MKFFIPLISFMIGTAVVAVCIFMLVMVINNLVNPPEYVKCPTCGEVVLKSQLKPELNK
jgi:hypothetical protein